MPPFSDSRCMLFGIAAEISVPEPENVCQQGQYVLVDNAKRKMPLHLAQSK
jgi:hypothetical protein